MTIFDVFQFTGALSVALAGFFYGFRVFGWLGAIIGAAAGFYVGSCLGRVPFIVSFAFLRRNLARTDTATLKTRLEAEYYISRYILAELAIRHEPIEPFRDYVAGLLRSDDPDRRQHGHGTAQIWFPDLLDSSAPTNPSSTPQLQ
jgi:hypothetical protein